MYPRILFHQLVPGPIGAQELEEGIESGHKVDDDDRLGQPYSTSISMKTCGVSSTLYVLCIRWRLRLLGDTGKPMPFVLCLGKSGKVDNPEDPGQDTLD